MPLAASYGRRGNRVKGAGLSGPDRGGGMAEEDKRTPKSAPITAQDAKQERLAQALRANLLKRKENARAKRSGSKAPDEGGQG